jgi:hypothetical protein
MISLDIGFDREALESLANYRCPLLQVGFTKVDEKGNPIALARRLKADDQVLITFYDLTGDPSAELFLLSFELRTRKARHQGRETPFRPQEGEAGSPANGTVGYPRHVIYPTLADESYSTVFEDNFPAWRAYAHAPADKPPPPPRRYPSNQLVDERMGPLTRFQVAQRTGSPPHLHYYTTCLLRVGWRKGRGRRYLKTFRVDPEMIIDNNGTPQSPPCR